MIFIQATNDIVKTQMNNTKLHIKNFIKEQKNQIYGLISAFKKTKTYLKTESNMKGFLTYENEN